MKKIVLLATLLLSIGFSQASIDKNLMFGQKGSEVMKLQELLFAKGLLASEPTGYFGSLTLNAVKAYQTSVGVPSTGYVGLLTRAKMNTAALVPTVPAITTPQAITTTKTCPDGEVVLSHLTCRTVAVQQAPQLTTYILSITPYNNSGFMLKNTSDQQIMLAGAKVKFSMYPKENTVHVVPGDTRAFITDGDGYNVQTIDVQTVLDEVADLRFATYAMIKPQGTVYLSFESTAFKMLRPCESFYMEIVDVTPMASNVKVVGLPIAGKVYQNPCQ